jgi:hypothetical protein
VLLITTLPSVPLGGGGATSLSTVGNAVPEQAAGAPSAAPSAAAAPAAAPSPAASAASGLGPASAPVASAFERQSTTAEPYDGATGEGGVFSGSNEGTSRTGDVQAGSVDTAGTETLSTVRDDGLSIGLVIAGISLIIGFGLFALRWTSRRFGDG